MEPMADHGHSYAELEQSHENEHLPEAEAETEVETEAGHELAETEVETEAGHELAETEAEHELAETEAEHELAHANEFQVQEHEPDDGLPESSYPDEKQEQADEPVAVGGEKWPGWPGESIYRMLVPAQKVGSIIGRKGEYIKKTCEETKARIKILDGPPGTRERAVIVSAKEEPDSPLPPAIDGLLRVHKRVVDGLEDDSTHPPPGAKVSTRLLVPAAQAGSLIGKQGSTVKSIQEESNCIVRVLGAEDLPIFALQEDRIVEVVGEPTGIHKAVELIASHLRKFLVDRSIVSVIEMQMQKPNAPPMEHMPPPRHWGPPPQSFVQNTHPGPGYRANPHFMPAPPRQLDPPCQFDNYYPPPNMPPPPEKQPHQGISAYGREAPMHVHSSSSQAAASVITQMTQQMQIPLSSADAVIGTQGATISYIRRVSGATVTIQETRGVPTEMTAEISGTASQVQTAQQLIQNLMAEAAGGQAQTQNAPPADQGYNSYGDHGSGYTSAAPNPNLSGQSGGYSSAYGTNYGY